MTSHRIAIIGYGKIAQDQHIPAITGSPHFDLVAVTSGHAKSIKGVESVFAHDADMYAQTPDIDCVAVCNSPDKRYAAARTAILAGKSVLLEKPPAATVGQARALSDLARQNGVSVFATWHARENPAVAEAARRLHGQTIRSLKVTWKEDVRKWHPGQEWVWAAGGFGVFDPGINALSIVTAILPHAIFVEAARLSIPANRQSPIAVQLSFKTEPSMDSATAEFDWRQEGPQTWDIEIETEAGEKLLLSEGGARLSVQDQLVALPEPHEYPTLYARFADLLARKESEMDLRPFELVADAMLCGERTQVAPFNL